MSSFPIISLVFQQNYIFSVLRIHEIISNLYIAFVVEIYDGKNTNLNMTKNTPPSKVEHMIFNDSVVNESGF